jgi:glycosyltransferase involved in cell wall biosynthesis
MKNLKFSIITPEHSPKNIPFLLELYDSILNQTYENWEWVLFLNNGCMFEHIPDKIKDNPKVITFLSQEKHINVGSVKRDAFSLGTGDILVEVDHDDLLTPNCLEELNKAFQDDSIGFVYSNDAVLHMEDEFTPYDAAFGWTYKKFNWKGKELYAMDSFPPTSHAMTFIWYAPDHIRAWRKEVYDRIGGYDSNRFVCEDHELLIRTYLNTKMHHINEVLYIYRVTGDNTWLQRNEAIQTQTVELCHQYAQKLAEKDADDRGLMKVDIGGGINPYPNYFTIDLREGSDIVHDLNNGIPLPDNSVGVLNASHIIEHLHDKHKIMSEIHRVLAHGGWAFIEVPSTDGRGAFQDPTHVSYWNENSFLYYTDAYLANFIDNKTIKFQEFRKQTWYPNEWLKNLNVYVTTVWLVAVKEGVRHPHTLRI